MFGAISFAHRYCWQLLELDWIGEVYVYIYAINDLSCGWPQGSIRNKFITRSISMQWAWNVQSNTIFSHTSEKLHTWSWFQTDCPCQISLNLSISIVRLEIARLFSNWLHEEAQYYTVHGYLQKSSSGGMWINKWGTSTKRSTIIQIATARTALDTLSFISFLQSNNFDTCNW